MPEFTAYLSRCGYLLERGKPVSDILWYLGDEINHKPNQEAPFPEGYKYDYCNPDVLLNRLTVRDGMICTPEGICYRAIYVPDAPRMLPQTLEKLYALVNEGAVVIGDAPKGIITLTGGKNAQKRFDKAVQNIWGSKVQKDIRKIGKGTVLSGMTMDEALKTIRIEPDVKGGDALWMHRKIDGADWYFVCAPKGKDFKGTLDFRTTGKVEYWDPVTGVISAIESKYKDGRTYVTLDLPHSGSCFLVFKPENSTDISTAVLKNNAPTTSVSLKNPWSLSFPPRWGAPASLYITKLQAWKDLDIPEEAKAFSGTVTYTTTFDMDEIVPGKTYTLDLGLVEMIAEVSINGKKIRTLWTPPYKLSIDNAIQKGTNTLTIEVTSTWFNRLVYDAGQPEADRKTWTINGPPKDAILRDNGLLGPVVLCF
jgi:hypothetical protein